MGWCSAAVTGIALIALSACGGPHGIIGSTVGPSPVVLNDTSAAQLTVSVALNMGDSTPRDRTSLHVGFQHEGHPVKFVAGEHVECGGVASKPFIGSFEGSFATASIADKVMTCTYTSGQQSASLSFRVPKQLVILMPREGEQVPRGRSTIVSFTGSSDPSPWVVALSRMSKASAQPGQTLTNATLDTSSLTPGEGSIALTDPNSIPVPEFQAGQFKSGNIWARRMTMVSVVWV
jgi:hypothetical protein